TAVHLCGGGATARRIAFCVRYLLEIARKRGSRLQSPQHAQLPPVDGPIRNHAARPERGGTHVCSGLTLPPLEFRPSSLANGQALRCRPCPLRTRRVSSMHCSGRFAARSTTSFPTALPLRRAGHPARLH